MNGFLSVIVPIYNSEKYLEECVDSILSQTHQNLELILVNDGSQDSSLEICRRYESIDNRVIVLDKKNEGVAAARNDGIELAKGEYVAFVDSDDTVDKKLYEKLIHMLSESGLECAALTRYRINKGCAISPIKDSFITSDQALGYLLKLGFPTSLWAYIYKRDLLSDIRLNNKIHFFEDLEFNVRVLSKVDSICICNEELYSYRKHPDSINSQGVNKKRLSCLHIPKLLYSFILVNKNKKILDQIKYLEAYFVVSTLEPLSFPLDGYEKEYAEQVVSYARKVLPNVVFSNSVPIKFKIFTLLVSLNLAIALKLRDAI